MSTHEDQDLSFTLSAADGGAVDRLIDQEWTGLKDLDGRSRFRSRSSLTDPRECAVGKCFCMLDAYADDLAGVDSAAKDEASAALVAQTMARINASGVQRGGASLQLASPAGRVGFSRVLPGEGHAALPFQANWREALSLAAVILILISVTVPMLSNTRQHADRIACRANMMGAAGGFTAYAGDHNAALPAVYDEAPEGNWLSSRANAANLFSLAKAGYVPLQTIVCPSNRYAGTDDALLDGSNWTSRRSSGYSYQNMLTNHQPKWDSPTPIAILSDRNPLVDASCGEGILDEATGDDRSACHAGAAQNVLINDGHVAELSGSPVFAGDNIWLPRSVEKDPCNIRKLTGTEMPVDDRDAMLIQ